jgi:hypothetical protein
MPTYLIYIAFIALPKVVIILPDIILASTILVKKKREENSIPKVIYSLRFLRASKKKEIN